MAHRQKVVLPAPKSVFDSNIGNSPSAILMAANNGLLYGQTRQSLEAPGEPYGHGVLFEYDLGSDSLKKSFQNMSRKFVTLN